MTELVSVPIKDGEILFATAGSGGPEAYTGIGVIKKAEQSFDEVLAAVRAMGEAMADELSGLDFADAEASFGISFTGKGKFIVAEASAQGSVKVTMRFSGR